MSLLLFMVPPLPPLLELSFYLDRLISFPNYNVLLA